MICSKTIKEIQILASIKQLYYQELNCHEIYHNSPLLVYSYSIPLSLKLAVLMSSIIVML